MSVLVSLVIGVHLLLVDLASGAPLLAACIEWRRERAAGEQARWARHLLVVSLVALFIGSMLGLAAGWYLWSRGLAEALGRMPSKVYYGVWELAFSAVCIVLHLLWVTARPNVHLLAKIGRTLLGIMASTNLLYHFPVLFAVVSELVHQGNGQGAAISAAEFRSFLVETSAGARALHAALASLAVAGFYVCLAAAWLDPDPGDSYRRWVCWGGRWALAATALQWLVGFWVFTRLPSAAAERLLANDRMTGLTLAAGLLGALALTHLAVSLAFGEASRRQARMAFVLLVGTVLLMTYTSRQIMAPVATSTGASLIRNVDDAPVVVAGQISHLRYPCDIHLRNVDDLPVVLARDTRLARAPSFRLPPTPTTAKQGERIFAGQDCQVDYPDKAFTLRRGRKQWPGAECVDIGLQGMATA